MWDYRLTLPDTFEQAKSITEKKFKEVNLINVREFVEKTRSSYWVFHCTINAIDCRYKWKLVYTKIGTCLKLDPQGTFMTHRFDESSFMSH